MSLLQLIRGKSETAKPATVTLATTATQEQRRGDIVATVASVTVASQPEIKTKAVRAWLALLGETDPATLAELIERCRHDPQLRAYVSQQAKAEQPGLDSSPDDRRTCGQCFNLLKGRCQAARRGEIAASRSYEPVRDLPRRCEAYRPKPDEADRRSGLERWPGLLQLQSRKP